MSEKLFLPESMYNIDPQITRQNLLDRDFVTGKVVEVNQRDETLKVHLGSGLYGYILFKDATIYPVWKPDGSLSPNIYKLLFRTIQAKVISNKGKIFLSRKKAMLEALEFLKTQTEITTASLTAYSKMSAFMDMGFGIIGKIEAQEFCFTMFRDIKDIGIAIGTTIPVKILGFEENLQRFYLSRTKMLPDMNDVLKVDDVVTCKVFEEVGDGIGYFVLINKQVRGILDSKTKLQYGDTVYGTVDSLNSIGARLSLA